jgi:ATP-dependent Clp protease, protease subunit
MRDLVLPRARMLADRHRHTSGRRPFHAEASGTRASLYLYDVIGEDWWTGGGVTAKSVQQALDGMKGATALDVYVNSPGGDVFEAAAIHTQLRRFVGERVVYVDGIAASAATFVAMAGDRIVTAPAATWMIHEVWSGVVGRASDMRAMADTLDLLNATYVDTYAKRTGQSVEDVRAWMAAETWMNASDAKARGFTDEISEGETSDNGADVAALMQLNATLREFAGR